MGSALNGKNLTLWEHFFRLEQTPFQMGFDVEKMKKKKNKKKKKE